MPGTGDIGGGSFWCKFKVDGGGETYCEDTHAKSQVEVWVSGVPKPYVFKITPDKKETFVTIKWT